MGERIEVRGILFLHTVNKNLCNLRSCKLRRRYFPISKHFPDFCPAKNHMRLFSVWTGLCRSHVVAGFAEKAVVKKHRCYIYFFRLKIFKNIMGIIGTVIVPDTGVVPSYYEMCTPVIFPDKGMENRLSWTCISHCCRKN